MPRRALPPQSRLRVGKTLNAHLAHLPVTCPVWTNCPNCPKRMGRLTWRSMPSTRKEGCDRRSTRLSEPSNAFGVGRLTISVRLVRSPQRNGKTTLTRERLPFGPPSSPSLVPNGFALRLATLPQSSHRACFLPATLAVSSPSIHVAMFRLDGSRCFKTFDWSDRRFWSRVVAEDVSSKWKEKSDWLE
jgi:hypothetical protein